MPLFRDPTDRLPQGAHPPEGGGLGGGRRLERQPDRRGSEHRMKIAILGTVGVPGRYGGFETLAENIIHYHKRTGNTGALTVWCTSKGRDDYPRQFEGADLRYVPLDANGMQSILYDAFSLLDAIRTGHDRIVLLGVSGAIALPLVRLFSNAHIVTNIDGIEWKREKWKRMTRAFLRASEWVGVRFSHDVIADNKAIADHVRTSYGRDCHVIAYGGDHAVSCKGAASFPGALPEHYALALCRIEPENNVHVILDAWSRLDTPLVFVGNWGSSAYGLELRKKFAAAPSLHLLDPVYDADALYAVRSRAVLYVHGHSAGGTNPSLVEIMHFGVPVLAHSCAFNRHTTENRALYFETADELAGLVCALDAAQAKRIGRDMLEIAQRRYTWDRIGHAYFTLLESACSASEGAIPPQDERYSGKAVSQR